MGKRSEMMIVEKRPKETLLVVLGKHIDGQVNREQFLLEIQSIWGIIWPLPEYQ